MHQLNQVEAKEIKRLDGSQLIRLLHVLLCAEARCRNIGKAGIHVPFEINVKDGGSDGKWEGAIDANDYIPEKLTFYQSKAQGLGPADCAEEIHKEKSTELKTQVKTVLDAGGAYVFFCSHPYNPDLIETRISNAREALKAAGRPSSETDKIHFLDGTLIAQWVNQHAAAFAYVCLCNGISQSVALRDYRHWAADPQFEFEFQSNEKLDGFISDIRSALNEVRGIARVTGPSGLGKTRLGFEVFHAKSEGDSEKIRASLAASVVYLDMQIWDRDALGWVNQLALGGYSGVIVVDNCSRADHNRLQGMILHPQCRLSLLTLDYVPESPHGEPILAIQLTPEIMRDVVPKILSAVPGLKEKLGDGGIQRVAEFAHGFPQIAILTARAGHALDLATLNRQGGLANRLLWGWDDEDPIAKEIIRCLAPFTEIGRSGRHASQLRFIRKDLCNGLSDYDFNRHTKQFFDKRVLQEVGDFLLLVPPPLAVALAADWLGDITDEHLQELLPKIEACGLTESFCGRLRQLDFSPRARALCEKLLGPTGPFASAEVLNSEAGSQVFRALSEVNPLAATDCLYRLTREWSSEEFSRLENGRRNLVWALEKLVWDVELFPKAARVLRGFAAGETESWANNATNQFHQLFHIFLPGTECPLMERLVVIEEGLAAKDVNTQKVCVAALGDALSDDHFSRTGGTEQRGTQLPRSDYNPVTYGEIWQYWRQAFAMLKKLILEGGTLSAQAYEVLGSKLGAVLSTPLVKELECDFKELAAIRVGYWPSAKEEIKRTLEYQDGISSEQRAVIERWHSYVTPTDLRNRLVDTVSTPGWHHTEESEGKWQDVSERNAVKLADELNGQGMDWISHIDCLLGGEQQQAWAFGRRCMELAGDRMALFNTCMEAFAARSSENRNSQLLRGMINLLSGTPEASGILDRVAADDRLRRDLLMPLTSACATCVRDFERVSELNKSGHLPPDTVTSFAFGSITKGFDPVAFRDAMADLADHVPDAAPHLLYVTYMYCYSDQTLLTPMRNLIRKLVVAPKVISELHKSNSQMAHAWDKLVTHFLVEPDVGFVPQLSVALVGAIRDWSYFSDRRGYIPQVVSTLLRVHAKDAWPVFASALRDENGEPVFAIVSLLSRTGLYGDSGTPLWSLPPDEFRRWAEENRDLLPLFLGQIPLYQIQKTPAKATQGSGDEARSFEQEGYEDVVAAPEPGTCYVWHPLARVLIEFCGKEEVQDCLYSNLFSFSSTGSRVPYLERRIGLVQDLAESGDAELKAIAEVLIDALRADVKREKKFDAERAAGIYSR